VSESTTYLSTPKAMVYVDSPSANAFRKWVKRHGVSHFRYGRELRFLRRDLDLALSQQRVLQSKTPRLQDAKRSLRHPDVSGQSLGDVHAARMRGNESAEQINSVDGGQR
jgi:hypothetical protein